MRRQVLLALGWYHPKTHRGIARFAGEHNWHLASEMLFDQRLPWTWKGDGILTSLVAGKDYEGFIRNSALPSVVIGNSRHGLACPMVREDNEKIGIMAAEYFLKKGFQNYAFFWTRPHFRSHSYVQRLKEDGYDCQVLFTPSQDTISHSLNEWLQQKFHKLPKPIAIYCPDDNTGSEVIEAALDAGFKVPEEISVLGTHNDEIICENLVVPLSSVDNDFERQGYEAAALLHRMMNGEDLPNDELLIPPSQVVSRVSTDILAYDNVDLVKALRFIKNTYSGPIDVDDVVAQSSVSRRSLYNIFKQYLNRSIAAEIQRHRLEEASKLVLESQLSFVEISKVCGFSNYKVFHRNFRKHFATSPREWRKRQE